VRTCICAPLEEPIRSVISRRTLDARNNWNGRHPCSSHRYRALRKYMHCHVPGMPGICVQSGQQSLRFRNAKSPRGVPVSFLISIRERVPSFIFRIIYHKPQRRLAGASHIKPMNSMPRNFSDCGFVAAAQTRRHSGASDRRAEGISPPLTPCVEGGIGLPSIY